jgi:hypothetical protein
MFLRSIYPSVFFSPVYRHFGSLEQAKSRQYRATSSIKRGFGWKNDPIAHNNDREERNPLADVCVLKYSETDIGVGGINCCITICARLGKPIITNGTSENNVHWILCFPLYPV